jgi:enoyl-CoA hydratase
VTLVSDTENVKSEKVGRVAILTLQRTKSLNALCDPLIKDLGAALQVAEADPNVGCIILTGAGRAFAAGADIKEMAPLSMQDITLSDKFKAWGCVAECRLPVIAAVNGFAFGGGCEIAMMCDLMIASEKAVFGQPEIKLGIIPGAGGTQRLVRSIGKSKAMALCLTGRNMSAAEAEKAGLVAEVVAPDQLMPTALKMAHEIANFGRISTMLCKEAVNAAYDTTLKQGVQFEKKLFYSLFGTEDKREGMDAFVNKRKASFTNQ